MVEMALVMSTFGLSMFILLMLFIVVYRYHTLTLATSELSRRISTFASSNFDSGNISCSVLRNQVQQFRDSELKNNYPMTFASHFNFVFEEFVEPSTTSNFPILVLKGEVDYNSCTLCNLILSTSKLEVYEDIVIETFDNINGLTTGAGGKKVC